MLNDYRQLAVTTDDPNAILTINQFLENLLQFNEQTQDIWVAAEHYPNCAMIQLYAAALYIFCQSKAEASQAKPYLERVAQQINSLNEREQHLFKAISAGCHNDFEKAMQHYEFIGKHWPEDLLSAKMMEFHGFETGENQRQLAYMQLIEPANQDNAHFLAMLALAYEFCGQQERCINIAKAAIQMDKEELWAHHALAHAFSNTGEYKQGIEWLESTQKYWSKGNQYIRSHMAFHLAALYLTEMEHDKALALYHEYIWDNNPESTVEQTDAILLLWYLELSGRNLMYEWQRLSPYIEGRAHEFNFPFLNVLYIYALAKAGEAPQAEEVLEEMQRFADNQSGPLKKRWQTSLPLAKACLSFAEKDFSEASGLLKNCFDMTQAGGSDEQRGVFWQSYLLSLINQGEKVEANWLIDKNMPNACRLQGHWQQMME